MEGSIEQPLLCVKQELEGARDHHPLAADEWLAARILECVANPSAICRFALINKNFSVASFSDTLWQKMLPPPAILNPLLAAHVDSSHLSKKHLYISLCKSITYDQGMRRFWLDAATGGECHMISARALCIVWGNDPRYWQWKPYPGSMFSEVACLRQVCWFEVTGTFRSVFRPGRYMVSFRLQLHFVGDWQGVPIKLCVQNTTYAHTPHESHVLFDGHCFKIRSCPSSSMFATSPKQATLDTEGFDKNICEVEESADPIDASSSESPHVWVECDVGEFVVEDDNENRPIEVNFSMKETEVLFWKGGLFLDGVIIRPSYVIDNMVNNDKPTLPM